MVRPIYLYPHEILRKKADPVSMLIDEAPYIIQDLIDTLAHVGGVGLAAPQIGYSKQLFIIGVPSKEVRVYINPIITQESEDKTVLQEGCLSVPLANLPPIKRPSVITLKYQDENFNWHESTFDGILAKVIQHEYDHLIGRLNVDLAPRDWKVKNKQALRSLKKGEKYPLFECITADGKHYNKPTQESLLIT